MTSGTILGAILALVSLFYVSIHLRINSLIKAIFYFIAIQNLLCFTVMLTAEIIIYTNQEQNIITCSLLCYTISLTSSTDSMLTTLISVLRFHMAWKASNAKIAKKGILTAAIFCTILAHYFFIFLIFFSHVYFRTQSEIAWCANEFYDIHTEFPISHIIYFIEAVVILFIGLYSDISLYLFIKKRNQNSKESKLVSWKTSIEEEKLGVPIRATLVTTITMIISSVVIPISLSFDYFGKYTIWIGLTLGVFWTAFHLPCLLIFTVNHKKKETSIRRIQPPKCLQFHASVKENENLEMESDPTDSENQVKEQENSESSIFDQRSCQGKQNTSLDKFEFSDDSIEKEEFALKLTRIFSKNSKCVKNYGKDGMGEEVRGNLPNSITETDF